MDKIKVAKSSLYAAIGLTAFKVVVGMMTGSLGILSEALHSSLDLVAALMTLFAVKIVDKPADREHNFGHGKFENLSALGETVLLMITCVWIIYEAVHRLTTGREEIVVNVWSFVVIILAIVVDFSRSRALARAAREHHSQALEADALHFSSDIASSAVVLIGLACYAWGIKSADAIASLLVSVIVLWAGWRLGRRSIDVLLDKAPEGVREQVEEVVGSIEGVRAIHDLRVRSSGPVTDIEFNIHLDPGMSLREAHVISEQVERRVVAAIAFSRVLVHFEPTGHEVSTPVGTEQASSHTSTIRP